VPHHHHTTTQPLNTIIIIITITPTTTPIAHHAILEHANASLGLRWYMDNAYHANKVSSRTTTTTQVYLFPFAWNGHNPSAQRDTFQLKGTDSTTPRASPIQLYPKTLP
jgi:hypothetical protein